MIVIRGLACRANLRARNRFCVSGFPAPSSLLHQYPDCGPGCRLEAPFPRADRRRGHASLRVCLPGLQEGFRGCQVDHEGLPEDRFLPEVQEQTRREAMEQRLREDLQEKLIRVVRSTGARATVRHGVSPSSDRRRTCLLLTSAGQQGGHELGRTSPHRSGACRPPSSAERRASRTSVRGTSLGRNAWVSVIAGRTSAAHCLARLAASPRGSGVLGPGRSAGSIGRCGGRVEVDRGIRRPPSP